MIKITGEEANKEFNLVDIKYGERMTVNCLVQKIKKIGVQRLLTLSSGRFLIQAVYNAKKCDRDFSDVVEGTWITVFGTPKKEERAICGFEIEIEDFEVISLPIAQPELSISGKMLDCSTETSMENRFISLRHPIEKLSIKLTEGVISAFRSYMIKEQFTEIHSPRIIEKNINEKCFGVDYMGKLKHLLRNNILYKEASVGYFGRVFEVCEVFHAVRNNSSRHLNDFYRLDFEQGFVKDKQEIMETIVALLKYVVFRLEKEYSYELSTLSIILPSFNEIPSVTFKEALEILNKKASFDTLDPTDYSRISNWSKENYKTGLVFVTNFPSRNSAFYEKENEECAENFVLLFDGLEIAKGGLHINDADEQLKKCEARGISATEINDFLKVQQYGLPSIGGAEIGLERLVCKLCGLKDVREAQAFPTDIHHTW